MSIRKRVYKIIFESDTPAGKWFDLALIVVIIASVITVMLDTVQSLNVQYGSFFYLLEWMFTIVFTIEYLLRLWSTDRPLHYAKSFFGVIDLISFLPTYLTLLIPRTYFFLTFRILRVLRIFRILKLAKYIQEADVLLLALKNTRKKIFVFLSGLLTLAVIFGAMMFLIEEGASSGFTSIPRSVYWAIVTITTVGYGDISPVTPLGQMIASFTMVIGYSIIAIPTGFVISEIQTVRKTKNSRPKVCCKACGQELE